MDHTHIPKTTTEAIVPQVDHPDVLPTNWVSLSEPAIAWSTIFMASSNALMIYIHIRPMLTVPSPKPNQNFQASFLYVYNQVNQLNETASITAVFLLLRRASCWRAAPQYRQYIAWGGNSFPHFKQKIILPRFFSIFWWVSLSASVTFIVEWALLVNTPG